MIEQERGNFPGADSPLFRDPAIEHWLDHGFKSAYLAYLAGHPRYSLVKPFAHLPGAVSLPVDSGPARAVLPPPFAQLLWDTQKGAITFWAAVAVAIASLAFVRRASVRAQPVTALVLLTSALAAIVVWNLTGNPLGSGSLGRQFMPVTITLRIGLLLAILTSADSLRGRTSPT